MQIPFQDRRAAGHELARLLRHYRGVPGLLVLALPRGGLPVAYEIARELDAPLDIFVVRKLGVPGHEELAMGAIATGGVRILNPAVIENLGISGYTIDMVAGREAEELIRRERAYRGDRPAPAVRGRTVILVDDGLATGSSMKAAIAALRQQHPERIIVAVPVAAAPTCEELESRVDEMVCAATPLNFQAVSLWYREFRQTTDDEVRDLLEERAHEMAAKRSN